MWDMMVSIFINGEQSLIACILYYSYCLTGRAIIGVSQGRAIAFHVNSKVGGSPSPPSIPDSWQTTVIFMKKQTNIGENLFVRGGNTQITGTTYLFNIRIV